MSVSACVTAPGPPVLKRAAISSSTCISGELNVRLFLLGVGPYANRGRMRPFTHSWQHFQLRSRRPLPVWPFSSWWHADIPGGRGTWPRGRRPDVGEGGTEEVTHPTPGAARRLTGTKKVLGGALRPQHPSWNSMATSSLALETRQPRPFVGLNVFPTEAGQAEWALPVQRGC